MTINKRLGRRRPRRRATDTPAAQFEVIAEEALLAMTHVPATVAEYMDGLRTLIDLAETALAAAEALEPEAGDDEE
jgi:hypothetical protein